MNIQNQNCLSFQANINSRKLNFNREDFYVRIRGYGKNRAWANDVRKTADTAVNLIRNGTLIENILRFITAGVTKANQHSRSINKTEHTGVLRCPREDWRYGSDWTGYDLATNYSRTARYSIYEYKFDKVFFEPLKKPFSDIDLTRPIIERHEKYLRHGDPKYIGNAFKHIFILYKEFKDSFNSKDVTEAQLPEINSKIAEIRWLLAHATPWERGSDAIANVLMRAMYKALGIKTFPLKKGVSLDLEAYCTEMADYKKNFANYFEKSPQIID